MYGLELIEVSWANETVILFVSRRPKVCGDVYSVAFRDVERNYIATGGKTHDEQDKEAVQVFTELLNDEQRARKLYNVK